MFGGVGTALVTPFNADGSVDFEGLDRLVNHQIDNGTSTLVVMGTTGESATLSGQEKRAILDRVIEINNGRIKVVYGIGGNNTAVVQASLSELNSAGVDGILSVSPYYNKPTQEGIYRHYQALLDSTDLPIIVYNVPGRTSSNILAETSLKLAELDGICAVKEASGSLEQIMEIIRNKPEGFLVLSGDDAITLPIVASGGDGVISVVSNAYPKEFSTMVSAALANNMDLARSEHYKLFKMIGLLFKEGNPAGIKAALNSAGICGTHIRLPLVEASDALSRAIAAEHQVIQSVPVGQV